MATGAVAGTHPDVTGGGKSLSGGIIGGLLGGLAFGAPGATLGYQAGSRIPGMIGSLGIGGGYSGSQVGSGGNDVGTPYAVGDSHSYKVYGVNPYGPLTIEGDRNLGVLPEDRNDRWYEVHGVERPSKNDAGDDGGGRYRGNTAPPAPVADPVWQRTAPVPLGQPNYSVPQVPGMYPPGQLPQLGGGLGLPMAPGGVGPIGYQNSAAPVLAGMMPRGGGQMPPGLAALLGRLWAGAAAPAPSVPTNGLMGNI